MASDGSEIIYTNRLIVKTATNDPLKNYFNASAIVEGYDGLHFLQYLNEVQAEYAYKKLSFEDIEYVEYDFYMELVGDVNVTDTSEIAQEHLSWNSAAVQVDDAFELVSKMNVECNEIRVAVIDSGTYAAHDFFNNKENQRIVDSGFTYDVLTTDENNVDHTINYSSMEDDMFHGTVVSGVIYDNSMDNVKIVPYRITNSRSTLYSDILAAFNHALLNDIDIVNMSLSNELDHLDRDCVTLCQKIEQAVNNDMIIVVAAGNDTKLTDKLFPASIPEVITVSATDESSTPSYFSNFGAAVDIAAPGANITSPSPRLFTDDNEKVVCPAYSAYMTDSGTSYSAPLVSAAAATLKSINPDITPAEVERIIKETAYVPEGWDTNYGTGIVNFYNMVKAVLEPEYSGKPTIGLNDDDMFEIAAPEGTDSRIYYTLDGSVPTLENHLLYTEPIKYEKNKIKAIIAVCHENGKLIGEPVVYDSFSRLQRVKVNYKETISSLTDTYTKPTKWKSSDPGIASVDRYGNITGVSVGETRVHLTLNSGKTVTYLVTVEYAWWQQIIRILLLGFLWY